MNVTMFSAAWRYKHYIWSSIKAEIRGRFAHSRIAAFWLLAQPLVQVAIYATVLSSVLMAKLPSSDSKFAFVIYLLAGMLAWGLFSEIVSRSLNLFIDSANLLKKISFPRITLPLIVVGSALVNYCLLFFVTAVFLLLVDAFPGAVLLYIVPLTLLTIALAVGIGLSLAVLNVFIRDVGQFAVVVLNLLFWATPVVYPASIVPQQVVRWIALNPMFPIVSAFHAVLLEHRAPAWTSLGWVAALSLALMALALFLFRRAGPEMVDVL